MASTSVFISPNWLLISLSRSIIYIYIYMTHTYVYIYIYVSNYLSIYRTRRWYIPWRARESSPLPIDCWWGIVYIYIYTHTYIYTYVYIALYYYICAHPTLVHPLARTSVFISPNWLLIRYSRCIRYIYIYVTHTYAYIYIDTYEYR